MGSLQDQTIWCRLEKLALFFSVWKHPNAFAGIYILVGESYESVAILAACVSSYKLCLLHVYFFPAYVWVTCWFFIMNSLAFILAKFAFLLNTFCYQATADRTSCLFLISVVNEACYLILAHDGDSWKEILVHLITLVFAFQRKLVFTWQWKLATWWSDSRRATGFCVCNNRTSCWGQGELEGHEMCQQYFHFICQAEERFDTLTVSFTEMVSPSWEGRRLLVIFLLGVVIRHGWCFFFRLVWVNWLMITWPINPLLTVPWLTQQLQPYAVGTALSPIAGTQIIISLFDWFYLYFSGTYIIGWLDWHFLSLHNICLFLVASKYSMSVYKHFQV